MTQVAYGLSFSADAEVTHESDADVVSDNNTHEGE